MLHKKNVIKSKCFYFEKILYAPYRNRKLFILLLVFLGIFFTCKMSQRIFEIN